MFIQIKNALCAYLPITPKRLEVPLIGLWYHGMAPDPAYWLWLYNESPSQPNKALKTLATINGSFYMFLDGEKYTDLLKIKSLSTLQYVVQDI